MLNSSIYKKYNNLDLTFSHSFFLSFFPSFPFFITFDWKILGLSLPHTQPYLYPYPTFFLSFFLSSFFLSFFLTMFFCVPCPFPFFLSFFLYEWSGIVHYLAGVTALIWNKISPDKQDQIIRIYFFVFHIGRFGRSHF